jgi:hypothetical protein
MTNERSGRRSREPFAHFDPDTSSWKTLQPLLPLGNLPEPSAIWPRSGMWDSGAAYGLPTLVPPTSEPDSSSLLPTPNTMDSLEPRSGEALLHAQRRGRPDAAPSTLSNLRERIMEILLTPRATRGGSATETVTLLPTPNASVSQDGESFETWEARRQVALAKGYNGNGIGMPLLPTPTTMDSHASGGNKPSDVTLTDAVVRTQLGAHTNPRLDDGSEFSDEPPPLPLSPAEREAGDSVPALWSG